MNDMGQNRMKVGSCDDIQMRIRGELKLGTSYQY